MSRSLILGNGKILVGIDEYGLLRDFYYPFVGYENHVGGHYAHKIGIWADGRISWFGEMGWEINISCESEFQGGSIEAINKELGVSLYLSDIVYNEKNIYIRKIIIRNERDEEREIKLFLYHQFEMYESHKAHTAYYDPIRNCIIHYRNRRVFLINLRSDDESFNEYSTGVFNIDGKDGTFRDAEDGVLEKNPIEHGPADSCIGMSHTYKAREEKVFYYWIAVGESVQEVHELNNYIMGKTPEHLIRTTKDFWHAWLHRREFRFPGISKAAIELFHRSLLVIRAHPCNFPLQQPQRNIRLPF